MTLVLAQCAAAELDSARAPGWVQILPAGQVRGRDGRTFNLSDPQAVILASKPNETDLPIDYDHQLDDPAKRNNGPVPAAGWIKELEVRPDGIWGKVDWTAKALNMIAAKEYRYISPVLLYEQGTKAVQRIMGAALVHRPNLDLVALSAEASPEPQPNPALSQIAAALGGVFI